MKCSVERDWGYFAVDSDSSEGDVDDFVGIALLGWENQFG